ncbi:hypothetical protein C8Q80DRAFT_1269722 [Daedaleopsis nitida]|nr:hypothetical protein C8Q80DRAFT_1269722 [Daedaleopsis nitida]
MSLALAFHHSPTPLVPRASQTPTPLPMAATTTTGTSITNMLASLYGWSDKSRFEEDLDQMGELVNTLNASTTNTSHTIPAFMLSWITEHNRSWQPSATFDYDRLDPAIALTKLGTFTGALGHHFELQEGWWDEYAAAPSAKPVPSPSRHRVPIPPSSSPANASPGPSLPPPPHLPSAPNPATPSPSAKPAPKRPSPEQSDDSDSDPNLLTPKKRVSSKPGPSRIPNTDEAWGSTTSPKSKGKGKQKATAETEAESESGGEEDGEGSSRIVEWDQSQPHGLVGAGVRMQIRCQACQRFDSNCVIVFTRGITCLTCKCSFRLVQPVFVDPSSRRVQGWQRIQEAYILWKWANEADSKAEHPCDHIPDFIQDSLNFQPPAWYRDAYYAITRKKSAKATIDLTHVDSDDEASAPTKPPKGTKAKPVVHKTYGKAKPEPSGPNSSKPEPAKLWSSTQLASKPDSKRGPSREPDEAPIRKHARRSASLSAPDDAGEAEGAPVNRTRLAIRVSCEQRPWSSIPTVQQLMELRCSKKPEEDADAMENDDSGLVQFLQLKDLTLDPLDLSLNPEARIHVQLDALEKKYDTALQAMRQSVDEVKMEVDILKEDVEEFGEIATPRGSPTDIPSRSHSCSLPPVAPASGLTPVRHPSPPKIPLKFWEDKWGFKFPDRFGSIVRGPDGLTAMERLNQQLIVGNPVQPVPGPSSNPGGVKPGANPGPPAMSDPHDPSSAPLPPFAAMPPWRFAPAPPSMPPPPLPPTPLNPSPDAAVPIPEPVPKPDAPTGDEGGMEEGKLEPEIGMDMSF